MLRRYTPLLLAALLGLVDAGGKAEPVKADPGRTAPPVRKDRHALLVGVTFYENLPESKHLDGPANDVELMHKVLVEKFQFEPGQVVTLSEKAGKEKGKEYLPTKANIRREFERLVKVANEGEQVVIHLSGHGSQQPEDKNSADPEPDGLDEIFLPRDVGKWDGSKGTLTNAIIDDEIALWLKPFREKKVSVWITFDSCHSGSMIRGARNERTRDLDPVTDLGIPKSAVDQAVKDAAEREAKKPERSRGGPPSAPFKLAEKGGIVAIYAAQPNEVTLEREMPPHTEGSKVYGLLTYTIAQVLIEASEKSKRPITYAELARRIQAQYVAWGRTFPTPLIEGEDREREVLGDKVWPGRSSIQLKVTRDGLKINAGTIHGLTRESILSVSPPAGKGHELLGYVTLKAVRPFDADVEACDKEGKTVASELPNAAVCEKYFLAAGDQRLRVAIDPIDEKGATMPEQLKKLLRQAVKELAEDSAIVQAVTKPEQADWLVRAWSKAEDKIILVPGAGWSVGRDNINATAFGPAAALKPADTQDWLLRSLEAIHRAECVKRLGTDGGSIDSDRGIKVKVDLLLYKSDKPEDLKNPISLPWSGADLPVYNDDRLAIRVTNPGPIPIDVTLLFVSSNYGIDCLFPRRGELNRLGKGESKIIPAPADSPPFLRVTSKTVGLEQLVVLAVKGQEQPVDFSVLNQDDLDGIVERTKPKTLPPDALSGLRWANSSSVRPLGRVRPEAYRAKRWTTTRR